MRIRDAAAADQAFLEQMLFEAFFWSPAAVRPAYAVFAREPELRRQLAGWGRAGDRALVACDAYANVGAAWYRLWTPADHTHGFVDERTPELGIGVAPAQRSRGVGRQLLEALIERAAGDGFAALSLSVDPANRARRLYESLGFRKVGESGTSWTLLLEIAPWAPC